jgi:hypothetical protein
MATFITTTIRTDITDIIIATTVTIATDITITDITIGDGIGKR